MKVILSFLILCLTITINTFPLSVSADPEVVTFHSSAPYETLTPVSSQLVFADEKPNSGWIHTWRGDVLALVDSIEDINHLRKVFPDVFHVDTKIEGLPTLREQLDQYDEAFFEEYAFILWESKGVYYSPNLQPSPAPTFTKVYLQNGNIFIDDQRTPSSGDYEGNGSFEHQYYIVFRKEDLKDFDGEIELITYSERYGNPNTSDPTLTVLTLALIPTMITLSLVTKRKSVRK